MSPAFGIQPVAGALGAEVTGIDLGRDLDDATVAALRRAWLEHLVLFARDQDLPPARFLAFARRFGEVVEYPVVKGHDDGGVWHSDTTYLDVPPMASMLVAREIPPVGGDTLFANMYVAYEALSDGMKRMLEGLVAINSSSAADVSRTREDRIKDSARADAKKEYNAAHPVVRVHPETGHRALYVNVAHTVGFSGLTLEESAPILEYLFRHLTRPEFTCRFRWQPGSLAFWDNRCAQHNAINDYHGAKRLLHRITLAGDTPVGS